MTVYIVGMVGILLMLGVIGHMIEAYEPDSSHEGTFDRLWRR